MANSNPYTLQKVKLISFTVIAGLLLLGWQSMGKGMPLPMQLAFLGVCLLLTGIPHGALDHLIQQEHAKRSNSNFRLLRFLGRYVAMMLLYALAWYGFPQLSLLFFLLISCWHFGETDIGPILRLPVLTVMFRMLYGISVLIWVLLAHQAEVSAVLRHLISPAGPLYRQWIVGAVQAYWLIPASGICIITLLLIDVFMNRVDYYRYLLALQLVVILLCGYRIPVLPAFALYFAGWHSLITLYNIKGFITGGNAAGNKPLLMVWLKALPFSLIAIAGLLATGYLLRHYAPLFDPVPLLFVFLSLITLPHMEVMHKLNRSLQH